uniref:Solute carrier organic anion transporter family member 6A1 n=1 Tax=Suricata suricatta TaxID=37032 RepID=A0A673T3F9_SURSU
MQDGQAEEQPKAAPAEIAGNAIAAQAGKAKKTPLEMSTVPTSIIKLHSLQKKENDEAKPKQAVSKTRERNESLEGPCGLGCIVIPRCQRLNNIQCFLVFFCILVISQGVAFGLVDLSIATFQKRNRLSTTEILLLSSTYDISSCLVVLFISYYGGRGNIPRWITFSSFLVGLSSLFFAFPYITDGHYQLPKDPEATLGYSLGYVIGAPLIKGDENSILPITTGQLGNLSAPCNSRCRCSSSLYSVICGRDHIGYFSPCFAGCTQSKTITGHKTYYNCSCIQEGLTTADDQGDFIDARAGTCDAKCHKLPLFIAFIFSTILFSVFSGIPITLSILRYKSLVEFIIIVFFTGTIPGPIAFKMGADISCTLRGTDNCGETGDCWIYNKTQMAYLMVGLCCFCKLVTIFFTTIALCLYKDLSKDNSDILEMPMKNLNAKGKEQANL